MEKFELVCSRSGVRERALVAGQTPAGSRIALDEQVQMYLARCEGYDRGNVGLQQQGTKVGSEASNSRFGTKTKFVFMLPPDFTPHWPKRSEAGIIRR